MPDWYRVRIDEVQFECWTLVDSCAYVYAATGGIPGRLDYMHQQQIPGLGASDPLRKACTLPFCHLPSFMS